MIATRVGAVHEIYEGEMAELLVDPGSTDQIANKIEEFLPDSPKRRALEQEGIKRFRELYTPDKVVPKYIEAYHKVLDSYAARQAADH